MKQLSTEELMESLYENGTYPGLKLIDHHIDYIKEQMKHRLKRTEIKRHEFYDKKVIAKWRKREINQIKQEALNEYLYDLGLLFPCVYLSNKEIPSEILTKLEPFTTDKKFYISIYPNKKGRIQKQMDESYQFMETEELAERFYVLKSQKSELQDVYNNTKKRMEHSPDLIENKEIKHKYGTVKLKEKITGYQIDEIANHFGIDILIKYGKINWDTLDYFMIKQMISRSEILRFKKVMDIRLDFILTTKEDEENYWEYYQRKFASLYNAK